VKLTPWKTAGLVAGVVAFGLLVFCDTGLKHVGGVHDERPAYAAAVASLMAIWWLTEALPISITALVPIVLYPPLFVRGRTFGGEFGGALAPYLDAYIFLFAGGMCIAAAMQQCDLHRRIALTIMRAIGTDPKRLLFGMILATAFISLWISNTATAAMMVPIGIAVIAQLERRQGGVRLRHFGAAIMMSIAYASNIGGIGTKIGTAPNAQFAGFMAKLTPPVEVTFLKFLAVGLPFVAMMLPLAWLVLWLSGRKDAPDGGGADVVELELAKLGSMKRSEKAVLAVFVATAVLWIAAKPLTDMVQVRWKEIKGAHVEGGIATLAALLLLVMRVQGRQSLEFRTLKTVPWETLILLGGGFSMAAGIEASGLSKWMALQLQGVRDLPFFGQVVMASGVTVGLTAVASNTATTAVMLNVLKSAVPGAGMNTVLFASTIASSCDFALPAGTPPNAIVFGSGYVTVPKMAKTGIMLDVAAALLAALWCWLIVRYVLGTA
jgi:sodium-dependent dicarboxylate transporter 2/3/5